MLLASAGSLSQQQSSLAEDLADEEFTPEELSLVQHLLPPERFIRVLLALRVTLKGCSESEDFATPVRQLQPNFDSNTCASQNSTQPQLIERSDQHIHTAESPANGDTCIPRGNHWQVPDGGDDEEVPVPARQFPTAAAEFWSRLQHGKDNEAGSNADSESNGFYEEEEPGEQVLPHVQGSLQHTQSMGSDPAVEPASYRRQQLLSGSPLRVSTRSFQLTHVQGSMLQHLTSGRLLAGGTPRSDCGTRVSHHQGVQHSSAAWRESDSDAEEDDEDDDDNEIGGEDSNKLSGSQLQGQAVRGFLTRLHNPKTVSLQRQQQQQKPLHQTQQAQIPLQRQQQQQQDSVPQQHWQGAPAHHTCPAAASALPQFAENGARTSWQPPSHAEVFASSAHLDAGKQPLHLTTQGGGNGGNDGVEMSPMQSAVSAVVDRLQSVQMGLAGAEDRLALLSGVKLAGTRVPPADRQYLHSHPMLCLAAQGGSQLHAVVQSLAAQDGAPQQDPVQSSAPQDGGQQHDSMQSTAAEDRGQQQNVVQTSAAQHGEQQHDPKQGAAGSAAKPHAVADIIRRFDSGSAWGSPQPGAHPKRLPSGSPEHPQLEARANKASLDSMDHAQQSPRISALIPKGQRQEEHTCSLSDSDSTVTDRGNGSLLLPSNPDCSLPCEGSSALPQLEGLLRHPSITQGTELQPRLRGQGSSMRGDLWLPQLWLQPQEQMQGAASPRKRMHKAMEAVREAERAVEAASVFAPTRSQARGANF